MFLVIFLTCIVTVMILIVTSTSYLISLLCEESDDSGSGSMTLALDTHDFSTTPAASPANIGLQLKGKNATLKQEHLQSSLPSISEEPMENMESSTVLPEESFKDASDSIAHERLHSKEPDKESDTKPELDDETKSPWNTSAAAQKSLLSTHLGNSASKLLFEDFDSKEMSLGGTGLHWCKSRKSLDMLVDLGVPVNQVNRRNETALHVAIRKRKLQVLIGLLCYNSNVNSRNQNGETPLILACKMNDIFACQLLLVFDAKFNLVDNFGLSARHHTASICDRHKNQQHQQHQQLPSASHLVLAMLNEIGASRCPKILDCTKLESNHNEPLKKTSKSNLACCTDGCSANGSYDGNSYNRWPCFNKESLYKRHMFSDIIDDLVHSRKDRNYDRHNSNSNKKESRLLCIDGGGLRGVIVCQMMIEIEKYLKKPMISYFDWVGGTSVGAFLSCALCHGTSLQQLRRICFDVKDEVFSGAKPYSSKFIERVLKRTFGSTTRLSDVKSKKLAVTTVIADRDPCQLRFFRNYVSPTQLLELNGYPADKFDNLSGHSVIFRCRNPRRSLISSPGYSKQTIRSSKSTKEPVNSTIDNKHQAQISSPSLEPSESNDWLPKNSDKESIAEYIIEEEEQDPLMWQAVRASAAAPFFFKPYGPYLDGGIISNNPTIDMLTEFFNFERAKRFLRSRQVHKPLGIKSNDEQPSKLKLVVSLGTGRGRVIGKQAMTDFSQVSAGFSTVFSPVELLRSLRAARDLFRKLMQQSCHTEDHILDRAQAWCSSLEIPYFRINPPLTSIFSIDDKRDEQIINALWQSKLYMKAIGPQLQELSDILDGN